MDFDMYKQPNSMLSVNMQPESKTYHVSCNYCNMDTNFINFNDFLDHARKVHGPEIAVSAVKIVADKNCKKTKFKKEGRRTKDEISEDDCKGTSRQSPLSSLPVYDLSRLKRQCLLELIQLLNKCLCIWHKPTRMRTTRKDRIHAYQLLLLKLREYQPDTVFRDVRSIVRQLITNFFCHQMNYQEPEENSINNPTCSRTIIEELMFLSSADVKNFSELNINKLCSFCNLGFYAFDSLWTHMVNAHILKHNPKEKPILSLKSSGHAANVTQNKSDDEELDTLNDRKERSRSHSRNRDRSDSRNCDHSNSLSDGPSDCNLEKDSSRKLSRKTKKTNVQRYDFETDLMGDHDSDCIEVQFNTKASESSDSDLSDADKNPTTYFLSDYNDTFLEEFIDIYRKHDCLWHKKSSSYKNEELCNIAYEELLNKYRNDRDATNASISKVKHLIKRMRDYYHRLNKPNANPYRSHIWQKLAFIDGTHRRQRRRRSRVASSLPDLMPEYNCTQCAKRFKRVKFFESHKLRAHPPTECPVCCENFGNADDLHKHLLWYHRKASECPLCNEPNDDWQSPQHLALHFFKKTCCRCNQVFYDATNFQHHKFKCCIKNRHKCWHCNAAFTSTMEIRKHSRNQHNDERPFKCSRCDLTFKFLNPLLRHRKLHLRLENTESCESHK